MDHLHSFFGQTVNAASVPLTLGISALLGLFLFVMGRKLVKTAICLSGLCLGAVGAFVAANHFNVKPELMLVWVIGGAVAGALLAWIGFRFWMAASLAGLAALAVPALGVIWQGTPTPAAADVTAPPSSKSTDGEPKKRSDLPVNQFSAEDVKKTVDKAKEVTGIDDEDIEKAKQTVIDAVQTTYDFQREHLSGWWESMNKEGQRNMTITAAIAGLCGALLGFVLPYFSASIQTALVGGAILLSTVHGAINAYAPQHSAWLPNEPRALLITLCLITIVGICIQWTLWRRAADK